MDKISKFNRPKKRKYLPNVHKRRGTHVQCMNNHYAKFEYQVMKTVGVTQNRHPLSILPEKMSEFNTAKTEKNVYKIGGAHLQYANNLYAKFEYKGMKSV